MLIQLGLIVHLLSAVCVYAYMTSAVKTHTKKGVHVAVVSLLVLLFSFFVPFSEFFSLWDHKIRFVIHGIVTAYLLLSWFYGIKLQVKTNKEYVKLLVLSAYSAVCISFAISLFTNYILGPVLYSVIVHLTILVYILNTSQSKKYVSKKIEDDTAQQLIQKVDELMRTQQLYKTSQLKIKDVAEELDITPHQLSQILNDNFHVSFSSYINKFRVADAKKLLVLEKKLTIEAIGKEAGFGSKTTFFKVFKIETGMTPKQYIKNHS
ncbi:MAG: helix-turn-helix domain-containing protein [Bacteroidota bacterium]